jgi:uncharacterized spore protein YtfJ
MARRRPFAPLRKALRARDVFGKPVSSGGVTLVPVAAVSGGGGGSTGGETAEGATETRSDGGFGFGFSARPVGAYVIRDGKVRWRPAIDVTRLAVGAMVAGAVVAGLALRSR